MYLILFFTQLFVLPLFIDFNTLSSVNGWQQEINLFLAVLAVFASISAVVFAFLSFRLSRRLLYYQLLTRYSSNEMGKSFEILWDLYKVQEKSSKGFLDILKLYHGRCEHKFVHDRRVSWKDEKGRFFFDYYYEEINEARRQVSHFFMTAYEMFSDKIKALDKKCFKKVCEMNCFKLLYYVVEWLELANATTCEVERDNFTNALNQCGISSKLIIDYQEHRPFEKCKTWEDVEKHYTEETEKSKP